MLGSSTRCIVCLVVIENTTSMLLSPSFLDEIEKNLYAELAIEEAKSHWL